MHTFAGHCLFCDKETLFEKAIDRPYRSSRCTKCGSPSRDRALWWALTRAFPNWRELSIHESSPGWEQSSIRLAKECVGYVASQFNEAYPNGKIIEDERLPCQRYVVQNLEDQTFRDESFDIVVAQDVFEHLFDPLKAIAEISRTLKPGGSVIITVPVVRKFSPSRRRAKRLAHGIVHLFPPEYHGNPMSKDGSLVTIDYGYDICALLASASDTNSHSG